MPGQVTVPNILTMARMAMAPAAVAMAVNDWSAAAVGVLIAAALLDAFDGWYARTFSQSSALGAHLDPFADKILMGVVFGWVGVESGSPWVWRMIILVAVRETFVTMLRAFSLRRRGRFIPASRLGRLKMLTQSIVGLTVLSVTHFLGVVVPEGTVMAGLAVVVMTSYASGFGYVVKWRGDEAWRREYAAGSRAGTDEAHTVSAGR